MIPPRYAATVYSESPATGPGGAERCVWEAACALSDRGRVRVAHHKPPGAMENAAESFGVDIPDGVDVVWFPRRSDRSVGRGWWPASRRARAWRGGLTRDSEIFVGFFHAKPPFCHARRGVAVVLFPTYNPGGGGMRGGLGVRLRNELEWRLRMRTYSGWFAISRFSQDWTHRRWGVRADLLHPPVAAVPGRVSKERKILSVGRFAGSGHLKRQPEMIDVFSRSCERFEGFSYVCVGGLSDQAEDRVVFDRSVSKAKGTGVDVRPNVSRAELMAHYATSSIFWHAAGWGCDESSHPEDAEHFGITTVEAMSAGCVPVVIRRGGQAEIVEDGVSGFLWDTWEELEARTIQLVRDRDLLTAMSSQARRRAEAFSPDRFRARLRRAVR